MIIQHLNKKSQFAN